MNTTFSFSIPAKITVFSSDKHNYRTFFVDSTFAQFMNSRIQKLINSLTRGHTPKTDAVDSETGTAPAAVGDTQEENVVDPRAAAQHTPNTTLSST